jgi:hypothetical protein
VGVGGGCEGGGGNNRKWDAVSATAGPAGAGETQVNATKVIARIRNDISLRSIPRTPAVDSARRIPGTSIRIGVDPILNLLPGVDLVVSKGISAYLIWEAHRLGAPVGVLMRMVGNLALDAVISAVPLAGWVGDVFHRANLRNVRLLREHLDSHNRLAHQYS